VRSLRESPGNATLAVLADPARACAELLTGAASTAGHLVLAGDRTPRRAYELAARDAMAWRGATLWSGDERCVPPEDKRSNYAMLEAALLSRLDAGSRPDVPRIRAERGPLDAAIDYERRLRDAGPPAFELVLLGLGLDGHTASLFPDQVALDERERLVVGVEHPGRAPYVPRVTLTLPALASTRRAVFLVAGAEKADAVAAAFGPHARPDPHVPTSMLPPLVGEALVLLDAAAASRV
jgi:6-phosphogluconolactonase